MPIVLQRRDVRILAAVAQYGCVTRSQLCQKLGETERIMRRRLRLLARDGYINRHSSHATISNSTETPVYYTSKLGCQILSEQLRDDRHLLVKTSLPQKEVAHSVEVSQTHMLLDEAISRQSDVNLVAWINEHEIVNKDESNAKLHRTTCIHFDQAIQAKNKVVCRPDSVFALECSGARCVYLLEEDRNTTHGTDKLIRRKLPGYERLFQTKQHVAHFREAFGDVLPVFRVIFCAPSSARRDALRRQMRSKMNGKPNEFAGVWRFVSKSELNIDNFLHGDVFYGCENEAVAAPLVNMNKIALPVQTEQIDAVASIAVT